jgi:hypothetical protein
VVFVPHLAKHRFPGHRRNSELVAAGILNTDTAAAREQDDQCLFFVAISRARDQLVLSKAMHYGGRNAEPSPLLILLEGGFAAEPPIRMSWHSTPAPTGNASTPTGSAGVPPTPVDEAAETFPLSSTDPSGQAAPPNTVAQPTQAATSPPGIDLHDLETYLQCPQRYAYARELGLEGAVWPARHFHAAIRRALGNLQGGVPYTDAEAEAALQEAWLVPHEPLPYESLYLARARRAIMDVLGRQAERAAASTSTEHNVPFQLIRPHGTVQGRFDRLDHAPDTLPRATVYRTGKQQDNHRRDLRTALAQAALDTLHGGGTVRQEYVLTGAIDDKIGRAKTLADRLAEADTALQGVAEGRFAPKPSRNCPLCPFWLLCPGVGDQEPGEE